MAEIRLVAVDEDGTFLRDHVTYDHERFERIWDRMQELGVRFCVATGNQCHQVRGLFPAYAHEMSIVSANGAYVVDGDEEVFVAKAAPEAVRRMIGLCHLRREVPFQMIGADAAHVERAYPQSFFDEMNIYCTRQFWVDDYSDVRDRIFMFSSVVDEDVVEREIAYFRDNLDGLMDVVGSGEGYFDVVCPGISKATGLQHLCERRGITPDEVVAFGDSDNDLAMLDFAGLSYAMAQAPENVRNAADRIAPPNDEDGVLVVLEELLF